MTLRAKALLAISLTLVGLLLVLYASLSSILLGNVDQLEKQSVQQNVKRVLEALSDTLAKLDSTTRDYAWRNDTYAFIEDHNSAFIKSNLGNETMANLGISLEVYVDSSGHVVVSKGFDLEKNKEVPIPASLKTHLVLSDSLLKHADTTSSLTGIVFLSEGPLLVVSRPILMSEGKGPIRGTLLMGRFLSKAEFSRLSQITELSLTAHRWDEAQMTADLKAVRDSLSTNGSVVTRPLSAESIAGYTVLKDIYGKPALLLEVDSARPIYAQGQLSLLYLIVSLIVVGLVFGVLVLLLLERLMFSRLARLSTEVARVGAGGNLSARLAVAGKDELVSLASTINEMLQSLESSEQEHHKGEERLRLSDEILQRVSALVLVADSQGQIIYASPSVKTILDYAPNDLLGDGWWQISRDDPAQREQEKDYVARAARGEVSPPPTTYERMVKRRDGTSRWILWQDTRGPGDFLVGVGNDITARKQAEQALQEAERKLRLITENIEDVVFLYDMNRRLQYVNPAFETLTGYTIEELYQQNFINFIHPDDNARMLSLWEALFQGKSVSGAEFRIATKNGQTKWVWSSASPVFDAEERQIGVQIKDQDITQRKQIEEALRKAEEQYHSIFDNVPLGLYRTTPDGQILAANPTLLEMLGYPDLESLQKVRASELYVHPEDRPRGQAQMEQADVSHVFEMQLRRRDGQIIWVRDNARIAYDTHGNLSYYEGALEDITESKRIEEELRKSEERLRQLFENASDGIYIRNPDGTIKFVNRRFAEMVGLTPEQVVGRKITDLFLLTPEERERISQHVQEALVRGELPAMLEVRLLRPDGSIGYVQGNLAFIKERGQVQEMFGIVRDITERKQLEAQLKESEERYRDLIENATDMIITIDLQGNFVYGNKKAIEFLGYSYEEAVENLTRKPFWSILVEEDLPKAAEYFSKALRREPLPAHEYRIRRKDGSIATIEVNSRLIEKNGEIVGVQAIARDATEKKTAARERELLLSISKAINDAQTIEQLAQEALRGVTEILDVPVCVMHLYDPDTNELRITAQMGGTQEILKRIDRQKVGENEQGIASRTAFTKKIIVVEDLLASPLAQYARQEIVQAQLQSLASMPLVAEGMLHGILQVVTRTKRQFTERELNLLGQVANELALGISRKRAEAALAASEAEYRNLFDNASDGIYTLDRVGRFTSFNRKAEVITGYLRSEVLGQPYHFIIHPTERRKARASFVNNLRGRAYTLEIVVECKDGREIMLELSSRPLYRHGQIVGIQGIARDITERKQLEKMKDEFVFMVSHDLRTPLTSIKGYADLILAGDVGPVNPEQTEFLEIISRNTTRLTNLINDLLDIDRLEAGRVQLQLKPLDLTQVLQEVVQTFRVNTIEKGLEFHAELTAALVVSGNRERLIQVFANLLSNAIKYTPQGSVRLRAYTDIKADEAIVEIADSGIGMSPEELKHLFQKFYRAENPHTSQISGTGLGLAIAKVIIDQHRGNISVTSQQGRGSTFTVRVPLHSSPKAPDKATGQSALPP